MVGKLNPNPRCAQRLQVLLHANGVVGRALAALDRADESLAALGTAVAEARRIKLPFIELMLARDMIRVAGDAPSDPEVQWNLGLTGVDI